MAICHVRLGKGRGAHTVLVGQPQERRPLGSPVHRRKGNIKIGFQLVGWGMDWIDLAQDRARCRTVVKEVMKFQLP